MYIKDPQTQLDRRKPQWLPASYQTLCSNIPLPLHPLHSSYSSFSSTCFSSWPSKSLMNRLSCFTGYPSLAVPSLMESIHSSSSLIARRRCVDRALSLSNSTDCRPSPEVRQHLHLRSTGQEGHGLSWAKGKSIHSQWKTEGCQCGGDILSAHDPMLWKGCHLRLPQRQVYGAEKGTVADDVGCINLADQ